MITSTKTGYDTNAARQDGRRPNASLEFNDEKVNLWVYEVRTGWEMSGTTAQSSRTRTFFAHNFRQPSFTVSCQFPSQQHMALVAQFIRRTHKALESAIILYISSASPVAAGNRNLKGVSEPILAEGYVQSFPRVHEQHVYAPEVTFDFVVERIYSPGAWADSPVTMRRLKSWHDIVEGIMAHDPNAGFVSDPDINITPPPTGVVIPDRVSDPDATAK